MKSEKSWKSYATLIGDPICEQVAIYRLKKEIDEDDLFTLPAEEYAQIKTWDFKYECKRCWCNTRPWHQTKYTWWYFSSSYSVWICPWCLHEYNLDVYERQERNYKYRFDSFIKQYNKMST